MSILQLAAALVATTIGSAPQVTAGAGGNDPWPGRPLPPIYRTDPRGFTAGLAIQIGAGSFDALNPRPFRSDGGELSIVVAHADPYCLANLDRIDSQVRLDGVPSNPKVAIIDASDGASRRIVTAIPSGTMSNLTVRTSWPTIAFSSAVDEGVAETVTWPRSWPDDVAPFLAPSMYIESEDPRFEAFVQNVSQGQLRRTPIYLAAKDLVRRAILEFPNIHANVVVRGGAEADPYLFPRPSTGPGLIRGFLIRGAAASINQLKASPADLVCMSVAVLRAAGIPARPVIGIESGQGDASGHKLPRRKTSFAVWGEFRLPGRGWVPFDPWQMRGQGLQHLDVRDRWRWFGTIRDLNRRVAIAHDFAPQAFGMIPRWPAGWSWAISASASGPFTLGTTTQPILVSRGQVRP